MRIGFIGGAGHFPLAHFVRQCPQQVDTVAVCDDGVGSSPPPDIFGEFRAVQRYDNPRDLLDRFQPDMVNIGAVYAHNGTFAAMALERDIPVCCDKPVASSWPMYDRLRELLSVNSRRVLVSEFVFRSDPAIRAARQAVADGLIGQVALAIGQKSYRFGAHRPTWYGDRQQFAGTVLWVASHAIDFVRFCTGQKYLKAYGRQANLSRRDYPQMEEITVSLLEMANGGQAVIYADYDRPDKAATHGDDRLRLVGGKGVLEVRLGRCRLVTDQLEETDITDQVQVPPAYEEILSALRGENTEIYGTQASLEMAAVLLTARDAADRGQVIPIPD